MPPHDPPAVWTNKAPIDDTTKTLLLAAVAILGTAGVIGGARAALKSMQDKLREGSETAQRVLVSAGFFLAVFLAARAILESP